MFLDSTVLIGFLRNEPNAIEVIKRIEDKQLYTSEKTSENNSFLAMFLIKMLSNISNR